MTSHLQRHFLLVLLLLLVARCSCGINTMSRRPQALPRLLLLLLDTDDDGGDGNSGDDDDDDDDDEHIKRSGLARLSYCDCRSSCPIAYVCSCLAAATCFTIVPPPHFLPLLHHLRTYHFWTHWTLWAFYIGRPEWLAGGRAGSLRSNWSSRKKCQQSFASRTKPSSCDRQISARRVFPIRRGQRGTCTRLRGYKN